MLNNLLSKIKPGAKNSDDQEDTEDNSEKSSKKSHDSSDKDSKASDDPNKKRISTIIRVVVVLGLAYLALDMFVLKGDQQNESPEVANVPVKKPRKKKEKSVAFETPSPNAAMATPEANPNLATGSEVKPEADIQPPQENLNITPKPDQPIEVKNDPVENFPQGPTPTEVAPVKVEEAKVVTEQPVIEEPKKVEEEKISSEPKKEPIVIAQNENKHQDTQGIDKSIDAMIDKIDGSEKKEALEDTKDEKKPTKLEDKIVEEAVYVPPPSYEQTGRGLVYNCKDGYWACIDKDSYINCNKNMKFNKGNGKPAECAVYNVYSNEEDCVTVQKYNVSTSVPTTFCK